jgi:protoheme ferro-lyase
VARRVIESLDGTPSRDDGVVLASQGQPWQWDRAYPSACEHATYFSQRVRADLVTRGLREDRVRLAWLDWEEPGVTEVVRHLAALGCVRIRVIPATMPFDTVGTLLDLRDSVDQAGVDAEVSVHVLPAWGDDMSVARALRERILESAQECE